MKPSLMLLFLPVNRLFVSFKTHVFLLDPTSGEVHKALLFRINKVTESSEESISPLLIPLNNPLFTDRTKQALTPELEIENSLELNRCAFIL